MVNVAKPPRNSLVADRTILPSDEEEIDELEEEEDGPEEDQLNGEDGDDEDEDADGTMAQEMAQLNATQAPSSRTASTTDEPNPLAREWKDPTPSLSDDASRPSDRASSPFSPIASTAAAQSYLPLSIEAPTSAQPRRVTQSGQEEGNASRAGSLPEETASQSPAEGDEGSKGGDELEEVHTVEEGGVKGSQTLVKQERAASQSKPPRSPLPPSSPPANLPRSSRASSSQLRYSIPRNDPNAQRDPNAPRKLFETSDTIEPIPIWLQTSLPDSLKRQLTKMIVEHGGATISHVDDASIHLVDPHSINGAKLLSTYTRDVARISKKQKSLKDDDPPVEGLSYLVKPWHWITWCIAEGRKKKAGFRSVKPVFVTARRKGERGVWELGGERLKIWLSQRLKKERPELVKLVNSYGGFVRNVKANATVFVIDPDNRSDQQVRQLYEADPERWVVPYTWVEESVARGAEAVLPDKSALRSTSARPFTEEDVAHLLNYVAEVKFDDPEAPVRNDRFYKAMCDPDHPAFRPWSGSHTYQAWRSHFCKSKDAKEGFYDTIVAQKVRRLQRGKPLKSPTRGRKEGDRETDEAEEEDETEESMLRSEDEEEEGRISDGKSKGPERKKKRASPEEEDSDGDAARSQRSRPSQRESSARLPSTLPSPPPTSAVSSSKRSNANPSTDFAPAKRQKKISPPQPAPTIPSPPQDRTINLTSHAAASFSGSHVNPSVDRIPTPPSNSSPTDEEELPAGPSTSAANPDASAQDEDSQPSLPPLAADSAQALGKMYLLDSDSASHSQHSSRSPSASSSQQPLVLKSPNTKHQFSHPFLPRSMLSANNSPISQNRSVRESSESQASEPDVFASMIDRFSNVRGQVPSSSDDEEDEGEGDRTIVAGTGEGGIEVHEAEEQEDGAETQAINALLRQHNPPFPPIASRSRSNAPPSSSAAAAFEPAVPSLLASGPAAASLRAGKTKTMRSASGGVIRKRPSIGVVEGADEAVPFLEFDRKVSAGPGMEAKKGGGKKRAVSKPASALVLLEPATQQEQDSTPNPSAIQPAPVYVKATAPSPPSASSSSRLAASSTDVERLAAQLQIIKSWLAHVDATYEVSTVMAYRELMRAEKDTAKAEEAIEAKYGRKMQVDA